MGFTDKTRKYIEKRLRQKGILKNTSRRALNPRNPPTLSDVKTNQYVSGATASSPYHVQKQEAEAYYKSKFQWLFDPVKGVQWDHNPVQLRELAQDDAWVQMLVNNMTSEIANTPWQIVEDDNPEVSKSLNPFQRVAKSKTGKAADSVEAQKAEKFFRSPNPDEDFTDFTEQIVADFLEIGSLAIPKMFARNDYNDNKLVSDNPTLVHAKPSDPVTFTKEYQDKTGIISGYWQYDSQSGNRQRVRGRRSGRQEPIHFEPREVAWKDIHPRTNRRYGLPPTLAVKDFLMLIDLTVRQEQDYWSRGAFPAGFISSDGDIEEIEMLKDETQSEQGRQGGIMHISDPEADYVQMAYNWSDMEVTEREKWYSKIIAAEFQVPVSVVGLKPEDVNRSTFEGERDNFESNTLGPYLHDLERLFTEQFVKPFFGENLRFEFIPGMSENQRSSISGRVTDEFDNNLITRGEARQQLGYEELEEMQDGFKDDVVDEPEGDGGLMDQLQQSEDEEAVGKPFGPWSSFDDCVDEMQREQGYSEETAERVCGSLQAELKEEDFEELTEEEMETLKQEAMNEVGKTCDYCGDPITKEENKRFCSKECYNQHLSKQSEDDDEPLRGAEDYFKYDFQPRHVDQFKDKLQEPINQVLKEIFNDDRFNQLIERFAEDEQHDTTAKNSAELRRVLNDLIKDAAVAKELEQVVESESTAIAVTALEDQVADTSLDADIDEVEQQVKNRELGFVQNFSQRMEEDIRDTVSQGWQQGQSIQEIQENLQEKAEDLSDYQAERIARDQLQRATGEARNSFAQQHSDKFVEVWNAVGDDRTRPSHEDMDGKWKRPAESFEVQYERASGPVKENFPGDSEYGINCRCRTDLVNPDNVSNQDHAGA